MLENFKDSWKHDSKANTTVKPITSCSLEAVLPQKHHITQVSDKGINANDPVNGPNGLLGTGIQENKMN